MAVHRHDVCPFWVGYLLVNPLRYLYQNPGKILGPYVRQGFTVQDFGCAMGFFTLPMARMVGPSGKVIALDVQESMVKALLKRARKAGLDEVIEARVCPPETTGLLERAGTIDFILGVKHRKQPTERKELLWERTTGSFWKSSSGLIRQAKKWFIESRKKAREK